MDKKLIALIVVLLLGGLVAFNQLKLGKTAISPGMTSVSSPASEPASPETQTGENVVTQQAEVSITIQNFSFSPAAITVKKGTRVTWTNQDNVKHDVTSDTGSELGSELLGTGETYAHVFETTGTYAYHCNPHSRMQATVVVEE